MKIVLIGCVVGLGIVVAGCSLFKATYAPTINGDTLELPPGCDLALAAGAENTPLPKFGGWTYFKLPVDLR